MSQAQTFLITGATGQQGGHVARALLSHGQHVKCLVRNPDSASAQALQEIGAQLIKGDYADENTTALKDATVGCVGVFLNTMPTAEASLELTHAKRVIDASISAGIKDCVYSSVVNAGRHEKFKKWDPNGFRAGYWLTKSAIQDAVKDAGFESWTILQPGGLMSNFIYPVSQWYFRTLKSDHTLRVAYKHSTRIPFTDPADIAKFATQSFLSEDNQMHNKTIPVASQMSTASEMAETITTASGVEVKADLIGEEEIEEQKGKNALVVSQVWASDGWNEVDVDEVRKWGIKLNTFEEFLERERVALMKGLDADN